MYQIPGFTLEADDDDEEKLRNLLHAHSSHVSDVRIRYTGMGPYHTSADALVPVPVISARVELAVRLFPAPSVAPSQIPTHDELAPMKEP